MARARRAERQTIERRLGAELSRRCSAPTFLTLRRALGRRRLARRNLQAERREPAALLRRRPSAPRRSPPAEQERRPHAVGLRPSLSRGRSTALTIEESVRVTQAYSMDGHWRDPRPRIALAGDRLVLTDPLDASLRVVGLENFAEIARIPVDGMPYNVSAVGGSGLTH